MRYFSLLPVFLLSCFLLLTYTSLFGQAEVFVNQIEGAPFTKDAILTVTDDKVGERPETAASNEGYYVHNRLIFNLLPREGVELSPGEYQLLLELKFWEAGEDVEKAASHGLLHELRIMVDSTSAGLPNTNFSFAGASKMEVTVKAITFNRQPIAAEKSPQMQLIGEIAMRQADCELDCSQQPGFAGIASFTADPKELVGFAGPVNCAEEYDFEWTFYDEDSREGILMPPGTPGAVGIVVDDLFRNNATRITTVSTVIRLHALYREGYLLIRYRAAQYNEEGRRLYTPWNTKGLTLDQYNATLVGHEAEMNWQANTSFAEEGKQLPSISFMDGTLRPRQNLVQQYYNLNGYATPHDEYSISQQVIYDAMGRPAISTLPAPLQQNLPGEPNNQYAPQPLDFDYTTLARVDNGIGIIEFYDAEEVEVATCVSPASPMSDVSGAGRFYSPQNLELTSEDNSALIRNPYVADAEGYPFSVTRFTDDNTGRIRRQGGVGLTLQAGNGHDTRYYYGKPNQWELDRLFGVNVGYASHYEKHMVIDPNGQASVSYLDAKGRVIATALAGENPDNLEQLATYIDDATPITINLLDNVRTPDGVTTNYSLLVPALNTYDLCYSLSTAPICDDCYTPCIGCYYDVDIKIVAVEDCGWLEGPITYSILETKQLNILADCSDTANPFNGMVLPVGEYRITKTVRINENRYQSNLENYLATNTCLETREDFQQTFLNAIDYSACDFPCDCSMPYDSLDATCQSFCELLTPCGVLKTQMEADLRPGGQYASYDIIITGTGANAVANYEANAVEHPLSIFSDGGIAPGTTVGTPYYKEVDYGPEMVEIDGEMKSPNELDIQDFVDNWNDDWLLYLLSYHPEKCFLEWCNNKIDFQVGGVSSYGFDELMRSTLSFQAAILNGLAPAELATDLFDQNFSAGYLPADPYFTSMVDIDALPPFIDALNDYEETGLDIFEMVRLYMSETYLDGNNWVHANATDFEKDEAWKFYRAIYLGAKGQLQMLSQKTHCGKEDLDAVLHGTNWLCLEQPLCAGFDCTPAGSDCNSLPGSAYSTRTARAILNFRLAPGSGLSNTGVINSSDLLTTGTADVEANCFSACAGYRSAWRAELAACGQLNSMQIEEILNLFEQICQEGCNQGAIFGASSVNPGPGVNLPALSFEDVLSVYLPAASACNSLNCSPYMINFPPPIGEEVYGGPVTIPASEVAAFLVQNEGFLSDRIDSLSSCCPTVQDRPIRRCDDLVLMPGNNFISLDVVPDNDTFLVLFADYLDSISAIVTLENNVNSYYFPGFSFGDLVRMKPGRGYQISWLGSAPISIQVCGQSIDPLYRVNMSGAANYIAYLPEEPIDIATYFAAEIDDGLVSVSYYDQNGVSSNYFPGNSGNALTILENGKGYDVRMPDGYIDPFVPDDCLISKMAIYNRLPEWQISTSISTVERFLNEGVAGLDYVNDDLLLPAELIPGLDVCKTCDEILTLVAEFDTLCGSIIQTRGSINNTVDEIIASFLNSRLGWNRTMEEYNVFINSCSNSGSANPTCLICADPPANQVEITGPTCEEILQVEAIERANFAYDQYITEVEATFRRDYEEECLANLEETLQLQYTPFEYHYTLYYYDQAGNLAMTVPPEGVKPLATQLEFEDDIATYRVAIVNSVEPPMSPILPDHIMLTHYRYNNFNEVGERDIPDAVAEQTYYDPLGRPVLSRDGRQEELNAFSYTSYDELGRVVEVGEFTETTSDLSIYINGAESGNINGLLENYSSNRAFVTRTYYNESPFNSGVPGNLSTGIDRRNRVAAVTFAKNYDGTDETYDFASHYIYDAVGNVTTLIQDFKELEDIGHRYKVIDYEFDFISGNVHAVYYQRGKEDQFSYRYEYDKTNRLTAVYSSELETDHANTTLWKRDATYSYYDHGPLRRMVIGQDRLQGCDYAYTIQGWIKGVNGALGDFYASTVLPDMNSDGLTANFTTFDQVANRDLFKYANDYFIGDYTPISQSQFGVQDQPFVWEDVATRPSLGQPELFNGNISIHRKSTALDEYHSNILIADYDQLHRLVSGDNITVEDPNVLLTGNDWFMDAASIYEYDGNGNIMELERTSVGFGGGASSGNLNNVIGYQYKPETNLLTSVSGIVGGEGFGGDDWNPFQTINGTETYQYDNSGNLSSNTSGNGDVTALLWTPYGKVDLVASSGQEFSTVKFGYGPDQNRWAKEQVRFTVQGQFGTTEYQVRDPQGNVLATYERCLSGCDEAFPEDTLQWRDQYLYGSSRIGQVALNRNLTTPCPGCPIGGPVGDGGTTPPTFGERLYELNDHLGNVAVVFGESMQTYDIEYNNYSTSFDAPLTYRSRDYLPFGLAFERRPDMPSFDADYRFGFNGKENDEDGEWGSQTHYDYGFRIYNPAIARFLSVDPLAPDYPFYSPYHFAGNMPISARDVDGREPDVVNGRIVGYRVKAGQGPTQIASDINNPRTMKEYGYCLLEPIDWQQVVRQNSSKFPTKTEGGNHPGFLSDRDDVNDPEYKRLNVNPREYLTVTGDCDDCGGDPSGNNPVPEVDPGPGGENPFNWRRLWDSDIVRSITGDAISFGVELNLYSFIGVSFEPVGGVLMLHGPEAFTLHGFTDIGVGGGVEYSGGIFIDKHNYISNTNRIRSEFFGGFRTDISIDVGEGIIGGINYGLNNPSGNSPVITTTGVSIGLGATSPFGVGGNVNEGYTMLWSQAEKILRRKK